MRGEDQAAFDVASNKATPVTVVTPSLNQGAFIERTLNSVWNQRSPGIDIEHLVFDGGSTDQTIGILESWTDRVAWVSESDRGQSHAVNKGIDAARGEIIGWLNSDDIYYPGAIERVVEFLAEHPDVDVVYGMADHIDVNDVPFEEYPCEAWSFSRLKENCFICQPATFIRKSAFDKFGRLDESLHFCMDYELWLRMGRLGGRFAFLQSKLAGSRLYSDAKTLRSRLSVYREINDMFIRDFGRAPDKWIFAYAQAFCERRYGGRLSPEAYGQVLAQRSVLAAFRWNGRVTHRMWRLTSDWLGIDRRGTPDRTGDSPGVRRADVINAYRLLLGREPEGEDAIAAYLGEPSVAVLRRKFIDSREFREAVCGDLPPTHSLAAESGSVSREDVINAFRFILGREPESERAIEAFLAEPSIEALRLKFLGSAEFAEWLQARASVQ